ncbi:HAD family hydrolase [Salisaeta longa]|uniref:HAD family hydrolase n=1 Tax=Salisaeta longa TaxID=503170 RepID=UPI0003B75945|nr:HAD-IA family hydrolase [Salisaeta longa]
MDVAFVYFDIDDTLLDHRHAERAALADVRTRYLETFGRYSVDELQTLYHTINAPLWRQYAQGAIDKTDVKDQRFVKLLEAVEAPHADAARVGSYYMQRYGAHWRFVPGAHTAFEAIAQRYPVGLLTNGFAEVQAQKLKQFPVLAERAQAVIISEETGYMKPHPEVFAQASAAAETPPERILYVGDSFPSDVQGGQRAGWRVAWYLRDEPPKDATTDARGFAFTSWATLRERLGLPAAESAA